STSTTSASLSGVKRSAGRAISAGMRIQIMHHAKLPTLKYVRELLDYNPSSGVFTRKISKGGKSVGSVAGSIDRDGRRRITLKGVKYFSSRIAWLFLTGQDPGDAEIDHINRNRSDDSAANLRISTRVQNARNTGLRSDNQVGVQCVGRIGKGSGKTLLLARVVTGSVRERKTFPDTNEGLQAARKWVLRMKEKHHSEFSSMGAFND
ncbi:HNH endonuclease, partial [Salmonella enterica]